MPNINITVAEKIATNTTPGVVIVCGNSDYKVAFDFDAEWAAETDRVARFVYYKDGLSLYQDVAFTGNTVAVPTLYGVAYVLVGVYAGSLRTTTPAKVLCDRSILCGDPLEVLTPEEKAKLQAQIGDLSQLQTSDKSNLVAAINEVYKTGGNSSDSGQNPTVEPAEDDIPKVFFSEPIPQTKDEAITKFRYISKTMDVSGYAEFKAQGNSSMNFPKKNMTVKLYADEALTEKLKIDFKGWGKQNKFCLKANWIDITHSRNVVGARLWRQICDTRKDTLPPLLQEAPRLGAVDGFPIKVYSQGIYQGRYSWNIPKDKWTFNMDDDLENHVVLCGESNDEGTPSVYATSSDSIDGTYWSDEIHDSVPVAVVTAWNRVLAFVNESTDEEFKAGINSYINLYSLIDYLIFHVLFGNTDAYGKNQLLISYDLQNWFISAYDMDQFCGLDWNGNLAYAYNSTHPITVAKRSNLILKLVRNFPDEITARYNELRAGVLSEANVINEFERWTDICPSELVAEDYASTTANGAFTGVPTKATESNIQQIRTWIVNRFALEDTLVPTFGILDSGTEDDGESDTGEGEVVVPNGDTVLWESGSITPSAEEVDSDIRIRMKMFVDTTAYTQITAKDGYQILPLCYSNAGTVSGYYNNTEGGISNTPEWMRVLDVTAAIEAGAKYIRLLAKRTDEANINTSEGENIIFSPPMVGETIGLSLTNGLKNFTDGSAVAVTNGNHVSLTVNTAHAGSKVGYVNILDVTQCADDLSSSTTFSGMNGLLTTITAGSSVAWSIENFVSSGVPTLMVCPRTPNGNMFGTVNGTTSGNGTVDSDTNIIGVCFMITDASAGATIEFDFSMWIDNEKVI